MMKAGSRKSRLRSEYRRPDFPGGFERGKYAARAAAASNVVLEPELATAFPNSKAVNNALRTILQAAKQIAPTPEQGREVGQRVPHGSRRRRLAE